MKLVSCVQLFVAPWTVACQAPLSNFSGKHTGGLPFPTAGNLPNPGTELTSLVSPALAGGFFTNAPPEKPCYTYYTILIVYLYEQVPH